MFRHNSKYRLIYLIFILLFSALYSGYSFYKYAANIDKGISLIGGVVFGLMIVFQIDELYGFIKNKKLGTLNSVVKSTNESQ